MVECHVYDIDPEDAQPILYELADKMGMSPDEVLINRAKNTLCLPDALLNHAREHMNIVPT